jgi:hypothetical protein
LPLFSSLSLFEFPVMTLPVTFRGLSFSKLFSRWTLYFLISNHQILMKRYIA